MLVIIFIWVVGAQVGGIFRIVFRSFDKVLVHDPHQRLVVIEPEFVEERLPDLINVTDDDAGKENLFERHHGVQGGLDGGLEELAGVIVKEESPGDDGSKDYDGPEDAPVDIGVRGELRCLLR